MGQTNLYICITFEHFRDFFPPIEYWTELCGHVPLLETRPCPHVDIWIKQGSNITNVGHYLRSDQYQHVDNICKSKNKEKDKWKCFLVKIGHWLLGERDIAHLLDLHIVVLCLSELSQTVISIADICHFRHNRRWCTFFKPVHLDLNAVRVELFLLLFTLCLHFFLRFFCTWYFV